MSSMYTVIYLEINLIGAIICLILIFRLMKDNDKQIQTKALFYTVLSILSILVLDGVWVIIDGKSSASMYIVNNIINTAYMLNAAIIPYLWFIYVTFKLHKKPLFKYKAYCLMTIPLFIYFIICIISPSFGLLFNIAEDNTYSRGVLFFLTAADRLHIHYRGKRLFSYRHLQGK